MFSIELLFECDFDLTVLFEINFFLFNTTNEPIKGNNK
jgi:hypothetical protein